MADGVIPVGTLDPHQPAEVITVATMAFKVLVESYRLGHH
jgi:hypothetical protein